MLKFDMKAQLFNVYGIMTNYKEGIKLLKKYEFFNHMKTLL